MVCYHQARLSLEYPTPSPPVECLSRQKRCCIPGKCYPAVSQDSIRTDTGTLIMHSNYQKRREEEAEYQQSANFPQTASPNLRD